MVRTHKHAAPWKIVFDNFTKITTITYHLTTLGLDEIKLKVRARKLVHIPVFIIASYSMLKQKQRSD